jgi:hypothetical protein
MASTAVALIALFLLVALAQWLFARVAGHVDLRLMPAHSRRRVQRLLASSGHVYLATAGAVAVVLAVGLLQPAVFLG